MKFSWQKIPRGGGCIPYKVAKGFLVLYRSYKYGCNIRKVNDNPLTKEVFYQNRNALKRAGETDLEATEDMLATVGLIKRDQRKHEMMFGLPSQQDCYHPVMISDLTSIYDDAFCGEIQNFGKISENVFRAVSRDRLADASKIVKLIDECILEMQKSSKIIEQKCAEVLKLEYLDFETMDKLVEEVTYDKEGNKILRKVRKSATYDEKSKLCGRARRTYISQLEKGIQFFGKRLFFKMLEDKEQYGYALRLFAAKELPKELEDANKKKDRGAAPPKLHIM